MACSICDGQDSIKDVGQIEGYRQGTFFAVTECAVCGTSSVRPPAVDEKIYDSIYQNVRNVPGYAKYHSLADTILDKPNPLAYIANVEESYFGICNALAEAIGEDKSAEIIEVGCGQGYLTYALRKAGFKAYGLDLSEDAIKLARQRYGDYYHCGTFDKFVAESNVRPRFIFASEVIEHLTDPVAFISQALQLLPPDGLLVLTTPNKSLAGVAAHATWDTELPPVHLWWFTKRSFEAIANKLGCSVSFANFAGFYKKHYRFEPTEVKNVSPPILDHEYGLLQSAPVPAASGGISHLIKDMLPNGLVQRLRLLTTMRKRHRRDDTTAATICAIFSARQVARGTVSPVVGADPSTTDRVSWRSPSFAPGPAHASKSQH